VAELTGVEREDTLAFLRREWRVQRAGRALLGALVAAMALGLFGGGGPASSARLTTAGVDVQFDRFVRAGRPTDLLIGLGPDRHGTATVWIDRRYLSAVHLEHIVPEPIETRVDGDRVAFTFEAHAPVRVVFRITPRGPGRLAGRIGRTPAAGHTFRQFAFF
jgi:hypothetical protein